MSHPSAPAFELERQATLRRRAASRLGCAAAGQGGLATAADALAVLHALASSPDTAADALALLQEMQVYQVELDIQTQDLHESFTDLEAALRRQRELYDHQPVGSFTVDAQSMLHELNQTGADLLGLARHDALGLPLAAFFSADSAGWLRSALAGPQQQVGLAGVLLQLRAQGQAARQVWARMTSDPAAGCFQVALMDAGEPARSPGPARHAG